MSPITEEFTKEQLQQIIETDHVQCGEASSLARIALASLEAAPVASCIVEDGGMCVDGFGEYVGHSLPDGTHQLYAAPPAPVVPPEKNDSDYVTDCHGVPSLEDCAHQRGWNECRGAILQGSQPVSNRDELPMDYMQGHKDGLEWAARLAEANHPQTGDWLYDDPIELAKAIRKGPHMPELKLVQADADDNFYSWFGRFWHENYQQKNYTTSAKQMLGTMAEFAFRAGRESATQAGNSPVIPEGWVMVPIEPTEDMIVNGFESEPDESFSDEKEWEVYDDMSGCQQAAHRAKLCWAAMIAAAPKLE
ncbi:hypothetical protein [Citrobacter telavivensis]|uniref:hypothetical protein n=1 Tax=Citrobacter telavivensis TaxID=2653932 RepID=UPI001656BCBB|nr:hypothetical protein [Citrobacter telavivensis]